MKFGIGSTENSMKEIKSTDYKHIYDELGINLAKVGCVMVPLEPQKPVPEFVKEYLYTSPNKERFWIDGWVANEKAHLTLLYGLLTNQTPIKDEHIKEVLKGWNLSYVVLHHLGFFPSPYPDEEYWCIVGHIEVTPNILEGHQRLSLLPHINTFAKFTPHMTFGYIKCDEKTRDKIINTLATVYSGKVLGVTGEIKISKK